MCDLVGLSALFIRGSLYLEITMSTSGVPQLVCHNENVNGNLKALGELRSPEQDPESHHWQGHYTQWDWSGCHRATMSDRNTGNIPPQSYCKQR